MFTLLNLALAVMLFGSMVALQQAGRRIAARHRGRDTREDHRDASAAEGAVYALLGLLIAFTFSGAASRYETRYQLVVDEANTIGTAWLRLDLLPASDQPPLRDLFRRYTEARIAHARTPVHDQTIKATTVALQEQIWSHATRAARGSGEIAPITVLLPALNEMIDITTTRERAKWLHPPAAVFAMLGVLTLVSSLFAGYGLAGKSRHWLHTIGFAAVLTLALFVIIDFEFPRFGLIRVDAADAVLTEVRQSMH